MLQFQFYFTLRVLNDILCNHSHCIIVYLTYNSFPLLFIYGIIGIIPFDNHSYFFRSPISYYNDDPDGP